jgi:hypothetical protein
MTLTHFSDLLIMAKQQQEPQRLLMVFSSAELPVDADAAQKEAFARGEGGTLAPVLCVDKRPEDVQSFEDLVAESSLTGLHWDILFVAAMNGRAGVPPNEDEAVQPLKMMVEAVKGGRIGQFAAIDRNGALIELTRD